MPSALSTEKNPNTALGKSLLTHCTVQSRIASDSRDFLSRGMDVGNTIELCESEATLFICISITNLFGKISHYRFACHPTYDLNCSLNKVTFPSKTNLKLSAFCLASLSLRSAVDKTRWNFILSSYNYRNYLASG